MGSPEGELAIAQAVLYVALAPKSNAAYTAFGAAKEAAERTGSLSPPMIILNAPTRLMKDLGYGKGYVYDPDTPQGFSGQNYFPDDIGRETYYQPTEYGLEKEIKARLDHWASLRAKKSKG
jgi:putative ATPase